MEKFSQWLREAYPNFNADPSSGFMGYSRNPPKTRQMAIRGHYSGIGLSSLPPDLQRKAKKIYNQISVSNPGTDIQVNYMSRPEFAKIMQTMIHDNEFNDMHYYISYDPNTMTVNVGDPGDI